MLDIPSSAATRTRARTKSLSLIGCIDPILDSALVFLSSSTSAEVGNSWLAEVSNQTISAPSRLRRTRSAGSGRDGSAAGRLAGGKAVALKIERRVMSDLFERLWGWLQVEWSLWRFAVPAICNGFFSLVCYVIGWHLSSKDSAIPLARAGAAATAIAIGFTFYDYRKALQTSEQVASRTFKELTRHFPITGQVSQSRIDAKLQRNSLRADRMISFIQATVLISATLVWGFGDLASSWR
jgi:hypothetical protein